MNGKALKWILAAMLCVALLWSVAHGIALAQEVEQLSEELAAKYPEISMGEVTEKENSYYEYMNQYNAITATEYLSRVEEFEAFIPSPVEVVFLGDSITAIMRTDGMFRTRTFNRGIGGDTVYGVRARLDSIVQMNPQKVFLLIGINSIAGGFAVSGSGGLCDQYYCLFEEMKNNMPDTEIFIQSVLPANSTRRPDLPNDRISKVNRFLKEMCGIFGFYYVDIYDFFLDENGDLSMDYSYDGLHLSLEGAKLWRTLLLPYVDKNVFPNSDMEEIKIEDITVQDGGAAMVELFSSEPIGETGSGTAFVWAYQSGNNGDYTHLVQLRDGNLVNCYRILPISYPDTDYLLVNDDGAMALVPTVNIGSEDEFALAKIEGKTAVIGRLPDTAE